MIRQLFLIAIFLCPAFSLFAQQKSQFSDEANVFYRKEAIGGAELHSSGLGLLFRKGIHATGSRRRIWEIEFATMKHEKEVKTLNPYFENAKAYVYGKLNSFFLLRAGIGNHNVIYGKAEKSGVEVRYIYAGGLSLGFTKPYYLEIINSNVNHDFGPPTTTEKYDPYKHFPENIYGRASFFTGFDEIKLHPGIYAKFALNFEYSATGSDIKALETGIVADVYPKEIPVMAFNENHQFFFNFYVALHWGGKW